jgi:hypothetical protein
MKVKASIEPKSMAQFQAAMNDLSKMSQETLLDIGLKQAQLICREMMMLTPPMAAGGKGGLVAGGYKAGLRSVEKDIRKLYVALDGKGNAPVFLFQQRLALAVKANNKAEFNNLITGQNRKVLGKLSPVLQKICSDYDLDRALKKAKNYLAKSSPVKSEYGLGYTKQLKPLHQLMLEKTGGRFKRNGKPFNPLGSWTNKQVVVSEEQLMAYIQQRQATVGRLKAGWWDALMLIPNPSPNGTEKEYGRAGIGAWIKAQATGQGRFALLKDKKMFNMTVSNLIGDINNVSTQAHTKSLVLGIREANIRRDIENRVKKMVEQANKKQSK